MRNLLLLSVTCALFCLPLWGDQVVLKNGDRLSGTVTKADGKTLVLKTEYMGDVTIQWPAIDMISSSQPLHVVTQSGKTLIGPVNTADGNLSVTTTSGEVQTVPTGDVTALRNDQEQATYEKGLHPTLWQDWTIGSNVGFALTRGNSESKNLSLAFTGDRKGAHDEITMYANTVYATNDAPGAIPGVTANITQGGARYSHDLTSRLFAFGSADFQSDALQALNLRSILGGGLGVHAIKTSQTTFDVLAGVNYTRESFVGLNMNFAALTLGEELTRKLGASTVLSEKGYVYPDLNQTGQYLATFNFGTVTKLSKWFGWQNAFGDIYLTNPPLGKKTNDLLLTTGLNVTFTH
jgi:putative salt-induced outer membrane protein YdiY